MRSPIRSRPRIHWQFLPRVAGERAPGWVDSAVSRARQLIYRNSTPSTIRGFITPVLYLKRGREQLFDIPVADETPVTPAAVPHADKKLPEDLEGCVERLRQRECVAVIGPGVLSSSVLARLPGKSRLRFVS